MTPTDLQHELDDIFYRRDVEMQGYNGHVPIDVHITPDDYMDVLNRAHQDKGTHVSHMTRHMKIKGRI